LWCVWFKA